jgi:hypothetical protein
VISAASATAEGAAPGAVGLAVVGVGLGLAEGLTLGEAEPSESEVMVGLVTGIAGAVATG